jgi:type II secretory pathway predicted ATPase ExeA
MNKKLLSLYGLKWNPFSPEVPIEALFTTPKIENFYWKIEQALVREGGFVLVTGQAGMGKSVVLRMLADRLSAMNDLTVGALAHPQSNLADFYREMGSLFGCALKPHNRWGGFQALRERWQAHLDSTLLRPVLLIDEAQEMSPAVLSELRLLVSTRFDSRIILSVVLAGDGRLIDQLSHPDFLPLGSRIRTRLCLEPLSREELLPHLKHLLAAAGNPNLMTPPLLDTLCEHALGNLRVLTNLGMELLTAAAQRELTQLDEKLYLELFSVPRKTAARRRGTP